MNANPSEKPRVNNHCVPPLVRGLRNISKEYLLHMESHSPNGPKFTKNLRCIKTVEAVHQKISLKGITRDAYGEAMHP